MEAGLIKRYKGKYSLTLLGRVVHDSQMIISKALSYYSKLKSIESIEMSNGAALPKEELVQLINAMLDSHQIKDMIMKPSKVEDDSKTRLVEKKPTRH
jgi:hypothetical protein